MLRLLNARRQVMPPVTMYKDLKIEKVLDYDDRTLSFSIPINAMPEQMILENYIQTQEDEYVIKQISISGNYYDIVAQLNIDELEGTHWETFTTTAQTVQQTANLALAGTGWTCVCDTSKKRSIKKTNVYTWDILKQIVKTYRVEMLIDSLNKNITFVEKRGEDKGVYFSSQLNLKSVGKQAQTTVFYTRIIPVGKDGLTIESVNNGKKYLENYTYSSKKKTYCWKDERYTNASNLKEDAEAKLADLATPRVSYICDIIDLAKAKKNDYNFLEYGLGDTVTIIDSKTDIRVTQRIVKLTEYPENPEQNQCEISNTKLSFEELSARYEDTADTVDNITIDNGTIDSNAIDSIPASKILQLDEVIANSAKFKQVDAEILNVSDTLTATNARIGTLETTALTATTADIRYAKIETLNATTAKISVLEANALTANSAEIKSLKTGVADINTLMFGTASGGSLTTEFSNSVVGLIGDAQIKSAMIKDISADKILTGKLYTNLVQICSKSGNLDIADNTIQIKDSNKTPRVQIGKDGTGDYNIYIWDKNGKLMFDPLYGVQESGIKRAIIRNNMISDTANISGKKIDIASLISTINADGSSTLNASKIYVDTDKQTLDVSFKNLTTSVNTVTSSVTTALNTANMAKSAVNNMQIGGRNLLPNSTTLTGAGWGGNTSIVTGETDPLGSNKAAKIKGTSTTDSYRLIANVFKENGYYTISFWAKASKPFNLKIHEGDNIAFGTAALTTTWKYYTYTLNVKDANTNNRFYFGGGCSWKDTDVFVYIAFPKLEKGNKATDWSPAPEDVESKIATVESKLTTQGTQLTAIQGNISSKIWQQDITTAVTSLEIGGRNLLLNTNKGVDGWRWSRKDGEQSLTEYYSGAYAVKCVQAVIKTISSGYSVLLFGNINRNKLQANKQYTLSFDVYSSTSGKTSVCYAQDTREQNCGWFGTCNYKAQTWVHFVGTVTFNSISPNQSQYLYFTDINVAGSWIIANLKLEEGNKATSWTPAQEEIDSSITSLTTQYTSLNQTVNSLSATVSSNTTAINKKADGSTVTSLQSKVTSIQADLNGYKTTVNKTYVTKNTLGNYATTAEMNTAINQKANSITQTVSATYTTKTDFNNLQIGGRNYLPMDMSYWEKGAISAGTKTDSTTRLRTKNARAIQGGEKYILSKFGTGKIILFFYDTNYKYISSPDWYKTFPQTFTTPTTARYFNAVVALDNDATITDTTNIKFKLEKGTKVTDWTPSIEDMATKAMLELKIDKTDNGKIVSMINASADEINLKSNRLSWTSTGTSMTKEGIFTCITGKIGGFNITATGINAVSGTVGMNSTGGWALHAGALIKNTDRYAFSVGHEGNLYSNGSCFFNGSANFNGVTNANGEFYVTTSRYGQCAVALTAPGQSIKLAYDTVHKNLIFYMNGTEIANVYGA